MTRYYLSLALTVFLLTLPQFSAADKLYKWTDEKGVTHFGTHPPTSAEVETIKVAPTNSIPSEHSDPQNEEYEFAPSLADELQRARDEKEALCQQAKQARIDLESRHRIRVEQEDGSYQALSHEEKQSRIKKADEAIKEYCG